MADLFKFQVVGYEYTLAKDEDSDAYLVSDGSPEGDDLLAIAQLKVETALKEVNRDYHFTPLHTWAAVGKLLGASGVAPPVDPVSEDNVVY
jgi:hypothetical protein